MHSQRFPKRSQRFCSILVGFPSWLHVAVFVIPACWLVCFAARSSAGSCGCMRVHCHVRSLVVPSSVRCFSCFLCPLPPSPISFLFFCFFFFATDLVSVTDAQRCCHGGGLVSGVWLGKATGVVYLPRLGFICSPRGGGGGVGHWPPNIHL